MKIVKQDEFKEQYLNEMISTNPHLSIQEADKILA